MQVAEVPQELKKHVDAIVRLWRSAICWSREHETFIVLRAREGFRLTTIDSLIAAVALHHGATVLTLDQHFFRMAEVGQGVALPIL